MVKKDKLLKDKKGVVHIEDTISDESVEAAGPAQEIMGDLLKTGRLDKIKKKVEKQIRLQHHRNYAHGNPEDRKIVEREIKDAYESLAEKKEIPKNKRESIWKGFSKHYLPTIDLNVKNYLVGKK